VSDRVDAEVVVGVVGLEEQPESKDGGAVVDSWIHRKIAELLVLCSVGI